jgi:TrmH family RNA methyltransferase
MHEQQSRVDLIQSVLGRARGLSQRRARDAQGCSWIEGIRNFVQAHDAGVHFEAVVYSRVPLKGDCPEMLSRRLAARGVARLHVTPEHFRSVSLAQHASGIGAIIRQRWTPLDAVEPDRGIGLLVMEEIRSPGNLGTILRTAEACGIGAVILVGMWCDPYDPAAMQASKGGIFHLRLVRTRHEELRRWAASRGVRLVGLSPRCEPIWTGLPRAGPIGLVIGEERRGLSPALRAMCDRLVSLPMTGRADSLNVGVAAGVAMYELVRRREAR